MKQRTNLKKSKIKLEQVNVNDVQNLEKMITTASESSLQQLADLINDRYSTEYTVNDLKQARDEYFNESEVNYQEYADNANDLLREEFFHERMKEQMSENMMKLKIQYCTEIFIRRIALEHMTHLQLNDRINTDSAALRMKNVVFNNIENTINNRLKDINIDVNGTAEPFLHDIYNKTYDYLQNLNKVFNDEILVKLIVDSYFPA